MELVDLVRGAQDAMDRGDYRLATTASTHGLTAYPSCLAAHRILGEAHLELGDTLPATQHFEHTLAVDPLNVVARLGLGVASEEQKDYGAAYAHYLHAWEINPALDQVRDELVRLRGLLGVEDRLHPTRAGLAGIHARGGQLHRAANEWRAVLTVEPESRRARTSYAELLWRQGEDTLAASASRDALRGSPQNARALAILADVERRRKGPGAEEFAQRYRAVDPTGDVISLLSEWRPDVDLSFLITETASVGDFDFHAHAIPADQLGVPTKISTNALAGNQIAAPDLWDTLVKDLSSELPFTGIESAVASGVEPFAWNDAGAGEPGGDDFADLGIQPFSIDAASPAIDGGSAPYTSAKPHVAQAEVSTADIYTAALGQEVTGPLTAPEAHASDADELAMLFGIASDDDVTSAIPPASGVAMSEPTSWGGSADTQPLTDGAAGGGFDDLADLGIVPFSFDGVADAPLATTATARLAAPPQQSVASAPASVVLRIEPPLDTAAVAPQAPPTAARPVFDDPFVSADGKIDLTSGWDDIDSSLAAATPPMEAAGEYDDLAAELGVDGIIPFDANVEGEDDDAWAPLTEDDLGLVTPIAAAPTLQVVAAPEAVAVERQAAAVWPVDAIHVPVVELTELEALMTLPAIDSTPYDVAAARGNPPSDTVLDIVPAALPPTFDDEVISGIPIQRSSGYTELLRHVDNDELDQQFAAQTDPFENPDASGAPLGFDDLLAVTSRDGTAPLVAVGLDEGEGGLSPFDFSETDPSQAVPAESDPLSMADLHDLELGGLDPFDVHRIDETAATASDHPVEATRYVAPLEIVGLPSVSAASAERQAARYEPTFAPFDFDAALAEPQVVVPIEVAAVAPPAIVHVIPAPALDRVAQAGLDSSVERVIWPAFVNQTSELIDRDNGSVFARLRAAKATSVAAGSITVDRRLAAVAPMPAAAEATIVAEAPAMIEAMTVAELVSISELPVSLGVPQSVAGITAASEHASLSPSPINAPGESIDDRRRPRPALTEQSRLELMAMRVRLIDDDTAADDIATTIETLISEGQADPLALRVLGEAYLKLGRMEQAAAQFRQAMLARKRTR